MDNTEISDSSSQDINSSSHIIRKTNTQSDILNENLNIKLTDALINISNVQNATNSHPLMHSPMSPVSPDFPDLIPVKPRSKHDKQQIFNPNAHSTVLVNRSESLDSFEKKLNEPILDYNEDLSGAGDTLRRKLRKITVECPKSLLVNNDSNSDSDLLEDNMLDDIPDSPSALKLITPSLFEFAESAHEASDNENDKSVYEAHLSSNLENVQLTMNEKEGNLNFLAHKKRSNKLRRISVLPMNTSKDSDDSSLDSNTDSMKSEEIFADNGEDKIETDDNNTSEPIEPLSAADERRHARHWQRVVLPGGEQRTIDMRVIEPYKRVLSHGGYLRAGGHTAIVLFSACYLPDKSRVDYDYVMDNLFLYVLWTLERLVTEDYVLVYLHGGATKLPSFSWIKRCYQLVGRKLRKNLSHLYLVHPSIWIKTMLFMAKPFISSKFYRKISFMGTLRELMVRVPLEAAAIPEKVKKYDNLHCAS